MFYLSENSVAYPAVRAVDESMHLDGDSVRAQIFRIRRYVRYIEVFLTDYHYRRRILHSVPVERLAEESRTIYTEENVGASAV